MAGIVLFHPEEAELLRVAAVLAPQVDALLLFANSPLDDAVTEQLRAVAGACAVAVLQPGANVGLGAAYDALVERARNSGADFLLVLDQDSLPAPGMVARLRAAYRRLRDAAERPAIVGPCPVRPDGARLRLGARVGPTRRDGLRPVEFAISSGSLLDLDAAASVGAFRADFFIDAVDIEWCMRARDRGFSVWIAEDVRMEHRLGRGVIRLPLGLLLADQPPRRLYTFIRNQLAMMRLPHVPLRHKLRMAVSCPIRLVVYLAANRFSREVVRALSNGLRDGWANRLGPPTRAFD